MPVVTVLEDGHGGYQGRTRGMGVWHQLRRSNGRVGASNEIRRRESIVMLLVYMPISISVWRWAGTSA